MSARVADAPWRVSEMRREWVRALRLEIGLRMALGVGRFSDGRVFAFWQMYPSGATCTIPVGRG